MCNNCTNSNALAVSATAQAVAANTNIPLQTVTASGSGISGTSGGTSLTISRPGSYLISASATGGNSGTAGLLTVNLTNNGTAISGATASAYSAAGTTDDAGTVNIAFSTIVNVKPSCPLVNNSAVLSLLNAGVGASFSNVAVTVVRL